MNSTTIIGLIAATFTTISFIPQAVKTIKTKQTNDISLLMYILLTFGVFMWIVYGAIIQDFPVLLGNGVTLIFAAIVLIVKLRNK
jgi:MtN3 and saliva related transmembrane protein